ncbi:hypothetical protein AABB24_003797, partial [Solanum stoloniferum]
MNCMKIFILLAIIMAILSIASSVDELEEEILVKDDNEVESFEVPLNETDESSSSIIRGASRFLLSHKSHYQKSKTIHKRVTCNKNPRICRSKGSPGPFCCKKKCVNVLADRQNCGLCGKKCRYNETCCRGKCVNTLFHKRHCGGCGNKCQQGSSCVYGMC